MFSSKMVFFDDAYRSFLMTPTGTIITDKVGIKTANNARLK